MPHISIYRKQDHNFIELGCPTFPTTVNRIITLQNMDAPHFYLKVMILFTVNGNVGHPCSVKL
jgi:hypothetical protein